MGSADANKKIDDIYQYSCSVLREFEIWPSYFEIRYDEFKKFYSIFPRQKYANTLEIACGIGYQASFLSCISDNVIASDVDFGDMTQHSRGLEVARRFIKRIGVENVEIVNADAEHLQFTDEQFDFIYCSYSLQCIPDMTKALQEIGRVLKKDGYFFCTVPTPLFTLRVARIYYKGVFGRLFKVFSSKESNSTIATASNSKISSTRKWYAKLLPPSEHKNFFNELFLFSTNRWKRLFEANGHQVITKRYSSFNTETTTPGFLGNIKEKMRSAGMVIITKKSS